MNRNQVAPLAVLSRAFSRGQSATASEPSNIDSVSLKGDATDPQSKWSLPMTTGADNSPLDTILLSLTPGHAL